MIDTNVEIPYWHLFGYLFRIQCSKLTCQLHVRNIGTQVTRTV